MTAAGRAQVVVLMRHGEAVEASVDPRRPLSDVGRANAEAVSGLLRGGLAESVEAVVHSGKARAEETAVILAGALGLEERIRRRSGLAPMDDPVPVLDELAAGGESLALVGHLPFMGRLASLMLTGDPGRLAAIFADAACMVLVGSGRSWQLAAFINHEVVGHRPEDR